jgi:hypothetical protein
MYNNRTKSQKIGNYIEKKRHVMRSHRPAFRFRVLPTDTMGCTSSTRFQCVVTFCKVSKGHGVDTKKTTTMICFRTQRYFVQNRGTLAYRVDLTIRVGTIKINLKNVGDDDTYKKNKKQI